MTTIRFVGRSMPSHAASCGGMASVRSGRRTASAAVGVALGATVEPYLIPTRRPLYRTTLRSAASSRCRAIVVVRSLAVRSRSAPAAP